MAWMLIIMIHWGTSTAMTSVEFTSKENCIKANQVIDTGNNLTKTVHAYCVQK